MERLQHQINVAKLRFNKQPVLSGALLGSTTLLLAWAIHDYRQFKALGRGGVPHNVFGWMIVNLLLRPWTLRKSDTTRTDDYESAEGVVSPEVANLQQRKGERAEVGGIVPHRQLSQNAPESMREPLRTLFLKTIVSQNPTLLETKLSHYELHNPALYVHSSLLPSSTPATTATTTVPSTALIAQGEIGHVHPDLSIHLFFSQPDARTVLSRGWGERHRLARKAPWFWPGSEKYPLGIADTYLLLYGPRDEEEFEVVKQLLKASARYMTGGGDVKLE